MMLSFHSLAGPFLQFISLQIHLKEIALSPVDIAVFVLFPSLQFLIDHSASVEIFKKRTGKAMVPNVMCQYTVRCVFHS